MDILFFRSYILRGILDFFYDLQVVLIMWSLEIASLLNAESDYAFWLPPGLTTALLTPLQLRPVSVVLTRSTLKKDKKGLRGKILKSWVETKIFYFWEKSNREPQTEDQAWP